MIVPGNSSSERTGRGVSAIASRSYSRVSVCRIIRPARGWLWQLATVVLILLSFATDLPAQSAAPTEHEIKAGCLVNFAKLIVWPERAFADSTVPFSIGILGKDPFGDALERVFKDQMVHGREIAIRRSSGHLSCQLLFVSSTESENVSRVLQGIRGLPIVTVSEIEGFAELGGVIEFYIRENTVQFVINVGAADRVGVKIDSGLVSLASVIAGDTAGEESTLPHD